MKLHSVLILCALVSSNAQAKSDEEKACDLLALTAKGVMELRQTGAPQGEIETFYSTVIGVSKDQTQVAVANWGKYFVPFAFQEPLGKSESEKTALVNAFEWKTRASCLKK